MSNLPSEQQVSDFWEKPKIFEKSVKKEASKGDYVFYDGPPFATGKPHYGHIVASAIKDAIPRYRTMAGYRMERKWGWDCHGLPIENIAEKELGSKKKKDIEEMGVEKFNEVCRSKVLEYVEAWPEFSDKQETEILDKMSVVRKIVELGLAERQSAEIKVRQPLKKLVVKNSITIEDDYLNLIKDEVNVKEVEFEKGKGELKVELDREITQELELEGLAREIVRTINSLRKEAGLSIDDSAELHYADNNKLNEVFTKFGKEILREVLCGKSKVAEMEQLEFKKEIIIAKEKVLVGIKK